MNYKIIKRKVLHCIDLIYKNDSDFFNRSNYEVTISTKLAQYLFLEFKDYDVDCEYNKHIDTEKIVNKFNSSIRPDILIHKRGTDNNNLVCIEIKKEQNNSTRTNDYNKLKELTKQDGQYKYYLGIFIDFYKNKSKTVIIYFRNGIEQ